MKDGEVLLILQLAKRALEDYRKHTRGVMIPSTHAQGNLTLEQINTAIKHIQTKQHQERS